MASWARQTDPEPYETVELIVSGIIPIILIIIGTFGNLLGIFVLLKKQNRRTSTNIYLIFLCIMDTLSLYQWNLSYAVYQFSDGKHKITDQSAFLCKSGGFLSFYTLHTSAMFLTLVSLDRACLLWSRWYKQKIARSSIACTICILILLVLFCLNGFLFGLETEFPYYDNSTQIQTTIIACYYSLNAQLNYFFANQYAWIHLVIMYILPFSCMFVCTLMTVKKLTVNQRTSNQQLANNARRNRRISIMLRLMCLTYVIMTLPNRLCFSVFGDQIIGHSYTDTIFLSSNTLMYTRNALNVFFFYLSVSGFRQQIQHFLFFCYAKCTNQVVQQHAHSVEGTREIQNQNMTEK